MLQRIKKFFYESRQELRHVNWPTRAEAVRLTLVVILLSIALAIFLGAFDFAFAELLQKFVL